MGEGKDSSRTSRQKTPDHERCGPGENCGGSQSEMGEGQGGWKIRALISFRSTRITTPLIGPVEDKAKLNEAAPLGATAGMRYPEAGMAAVNR